MYTRMDDSNFDDVGRFHTKFNLPVSQGKPIEVPEELLLFRLKFMLEELLEFTEAVGYELYWDEVYGHQFIQNEPAVEVDHAKAFDALIDEVYVVLGTAHLFGYPWQEGWAEVQAANMAKARATDDSQSERGGSFDVIKPPGWVAPDIAGLLAEGGWDTQCSRPEWHRDSCGRVQPGDIEETK